MVSRTLSVLPPGISDAELLADLAAGLRSPEDVCAVLLDRRNEARDNLAELLDGVRDILADLGVSDLQIARTVEGYPCDVMITVRSEIRDRLRRIRDAVDDVADDIESAGRRKADRAKMAERLAAEVLNLDEFLNDDAE